MNKIRKYTYLFLTSRWSRILGFCSATFFTNFVITTWREADKNRYDKLGLAIGILMVCLSLFLSEIICATLKTRAEIDKICGGSPPPYNPKEDSTIKRVCEKVRDDWWGCFKNIPLFSLSILMFLTVIGLLIVEVKILDRANEERRDKNLQIEEKEKIQLLELTGHVTNLAQRVEALNLTNDVRFVDLKMVNELLFAKQ